MIQDKLLARDYITYSPIYRPLFYTVPASSKVVSFNVHAVGLGSSGSAPMYVMLTDDLTWSYTLDRITMYPGQVYNKTFKVIVSAAEKIEVTLSAPSTLTQADVHLSGKVLT